MKKRFYMLRMWAVALPLLACSIWSHAQQAQERVSEKVAHAVGVLKGVYDDYPTKRAIDVLREAAEKDTVAYAMNVLGLLYMEGIETEKDPEKAILWLNRAGEHGYVTAYHNLGMLHKYGKGGAKQNFQASYEAFMKGAEGGSATCCYDAGFMLYKGLGCKQDYTKAMELFDTASVGGNFYATYMLGLCYRNGYGTEQDEERGMELLEKSATMGYSDAIEEVARQNPENCFADIIVSDNAKVPKQMPEISFAVNDTTLLKGTFSGYVAMYDWSGQHILGEKPVVMTMKRNGKEMSGLMVLGTDSIPFMADITKEGALKFKTGKVSLNERYTFNGKARYKLDRADLNIWQNQITGNLQLYSLSLREPERPMYMELLRDDTKQYDGKEETSRNTIAITPNPFNIQFDAVFDLSESSTATARIFDKYGIMVWQQSLGTLEAGKHTVSLVPNIKPGYHVLNISTGKAVYRAIIVKKGGE